MLRWESWGGGGGRARRIVCLISSLGLFEPVQCQGVRLSVQDVYRYRCHGAPRGLLSTFVSKMKNKRKGKKD